MTINKIFGSFILAIIITAVVGLGEYKVFAVVCPGNFSYTTFSNPDGTTGTRVTYNTVNSSCAYSIIIEDTRGIQVFQFDAKGGGEKNISIPEGQYNIKMVGAVINTAPGANPGALETVQQTSATISKPSTSVGNQETPVTEPPINNVNKDKEDITATVVKLPDGTTVLRYRIDDPDFNKNIPSVGGTTIGRMYEVCPSYVDSSGSNIKLDCQRFEADITSSDVKRDLQGNYYIVKDIPITTTGVSYNLALNRYLTKNQVSPEYTTSTASALFVEKQINNPNNQNGGNGNNGGNNGGPDQNDNSAKEQDLQLSIGALKTMVSQGYLFVLPIALIIGIIRILIAIINLTTSGGEPNKLTAAKEMLFSTLAGLLLIVGAVTLINILGNALGI